jgi:hypothetical protein
MTVHHHLDVPLAAATPPFDAGMAACEGWLRREGYLPPVARVA